MGSRKNCQTPEAAYLVVRETNGNHLGLFSLCLTFFSLKDFEPSGWVLS